jgi:WD40 repeat protein
MRLILICCFLLPAFFASAQNVLETPEKRCRYRASREFLLSKNDSCFDITRREADRAAAFRCWDEAGSLYRAAKSCADANQKNRSDMNKRIEACRDSAEQELRRSEQAARRQYLHAAAANLANDAQELLKLYDRSAAYRLADFASQYVAPGQNPECLQAVLDAWYYVPMAQYGQQFSKDFQVPFCYELDFDLGRNVQARFGRRGNTLLLYAFAPATRTLYTWEASSFKAGRTMQLDEKFEHFDISPDGRTLVFFSDKTLLFWRSQEKNYKLNLTTNGITVSRYCFSALGDNFLFFDENKSQAHEFDLAFALGQSKEEQRSIYKQNIGEQRNPLNLLFANIGYEVLGMAYHDGRLWLGGRDSLVVLQKEGKWGYGLAKSLRWSHSATYATDLQIFPEKQCAVFISPEGAVPMSLTVSEGLPQAAGQGFGLNGTPMAIRQDAALVALSQPDRDILYIHKSDSGAVRHGAFLHPGDEFALMNGAFSPDGNWFVAATDTGVLKLWALTEVQSDAGVSLSGDFRTVFSASDDYVSKYKDGVLQVCPAADPNKPRFSIPLGVSTDEFDLHAVGKNWAAYSLNAEEPLVVKNGITGKQWELAASNTQRIAALDERERFVAYTAGPDSIAVRSLQTGEIIGGQKFYGYINNFYFIPNSDELLVVQSDLSELVTRNEFVAKFWNFGNGRKGKLRTARLHGYNISIAAVSHDGKQVAFGDTKDVRVFSVDNLNDESARIRPIDDHYATAFAFHPDGSALAVGYEDGSVIVWDLATSEPRFKLKTDKFWIEKLIFSPDGHRLQVKTLEGNFFYRDIAPALIRKSAQNENRRLVAFTPEQIRGWGLERALDESGNFQRLAESHDLPLIRSFFDYYRLQALSSNNIEKVKTYFESASSLYSKLDDPATQQALRPTMTEIYEDYIWKLLLRSKNQDAARVLAEFDKLFKKPLAALKSGAHTALLRNDLSTAASQYAEWTMLACADPSLQLQSRATLDSLNMQFRQLAEYDLLSREQSDCLCGLYANILEIKTLCPGGGNAVAVPFNTETRLRWNIFQNLFKASRTLNHAQKIRLLESALADATSLNRQNPARRTTLEQTTLALANAYTARGIEEQENEISAALYQQSLQLLDRFGSFSTYESARLKALSQNHWRLGNYLLSKDKIGDAARQYEQGLAVVENLLRSAPGDSVAAYRNDRQAPHLTQLGMVRLLEGNTSAAKTLYEQAFEAMYYGLNSFYFGHVALLENNENEALAQYRGINNEAQLGQVLFEIGQFARRFPDRRVRLEAFAQRLRETFVTERPELSPTATDYWYAVQQMSDALSKEAWADVLDWNEKSLASIDKILSRPDVPADWKSYRLDRLLSKSYYLLFTSKNDPEAFDKSIQIAEQAEAYAAQEYPYYAYRDWLKTNLAHAHLLRNQPSDRETAIRIYRAFLETYAYDRDHWELLQKDFRDLHRAGLRWPDLKGVIEAVKPADVELTPKEWEEMGVLF